MSTDVALSPAAPSGVVDDLPGLAAAAAEALRSNDCMLIFASLEDAPLGVEIDGGLDTLRALVVHTTPQLAYVDSRSWTIEDLEEQREGLVVLDSSPDELTASTAALDESKCRLGEPATLTISVVVGGVVHAFNFTASWYYRLESQQLQVVSERLDRHELDWMRENEQDQQERSKIDAVLAGLVDNLLQDETFLRQSSDDARRIRADELVAPFVGAAPDSRVRGAIAAAVRTATGRRAAEIVPARTDALRRRLPDLADALAGDPDFAAATTKHVRERLARALLTSTDPVVLPTPLIPSLVTAAMAP